MRSVTKGNVVARALRGPNLEVVGLMRGWGLREEPHGVEARRRN
jgi:hypothetical protein